MPIPTAEPSSPQLAVKPRKPAAKTADLRASYVKQLLRGVKDERKIHYAQIRPIPHAYALPLTTDCSGYVTMSAEVAGCPDPNGRRFDGQGYTGTMLDYCRHIPFSEVRPGDLIVYGPPPGHHVVAVVGLVTNASGVTTDLWCVSHGQDKGAQKVLHSVESQYQPLPAQFLSFLP